MDPAVLTGIAATALAGFIGWVARTMVGRGIVGRMDKIDADLVALGAKLEAVNGRYSDMQSRLALGNQSFEFLRSELERVRGELAELRRRHDV